MPHTTARECVALFLQNTTRCIRKSGAGGGAGSGARGAPLKQAPGESAIAFAARSAAAASGTSGVNGGGASLTGLGRTAGHTGSSSDSRGDKLMEDCVVRSVVGAVRLSSSSSSSTAVRVSTSGHQTVVAAAATAAAATTAAAGGSAVLTRLSLTSAAYMLRHPRAAEAFLEAGLVEEITALLQRLTAPSTNSSSAAAATASTRISVDSVSEDENGDSVADASDVAALCTALRSTSSAEDRANNTVLLRLCSRIAYLL
jgi:hypothetical protein